jgi:hypothetical protein
VLSKVCGLPVHFHRAFNALHCRPTAGLDEAARSHLYAEGISLLNGKESDVFTWLYATTEFFKVKKQIPRILQELGMPGC